MTSVELVALMDKMGDAVTRYVARALDPVKARISALETRAAAMLMMQAKGKKGDGNFDLSDLIELTAELNRRVTDLEQRPTMLYTGTYKPNSTYVRGDFCTHQGSLWHCWQTTSERPGESEHWQLVAKRGADGRDGRDARAA